jgi:hypothetical protein
MRGVVLYILLLFCCLKLSAQKSSVYSEMLRLQNIHHVHFLYKSDLNLSINYNGRDIKTLTLHQALDEVFRKSGINYSIHGSNILLTQGQKTVTAKPLIERHVLKGIVRDSLGEPLVNVSIYDKVSHIGTLSNEQGVYTLILIKGVHVLDVSWFGQRQKSFSINIKKDTRHDLVIKGSMELGEVVVSRDLNSPLNTTQTGKLTLRPEDINTEFSLLSSPDLVKTLQRTSGVAQGTELSGGLLVHGGSPDENLFLLDGTPVYQTNHSFGLFSAFNSDIIKNIDFYKSGFPARYSGRISSITDVRTRDGSMTEHHGSFSLGLIDGRLQFEGPIIKGRTSYNIALRRSWIELLLLPTFAIINHSKNGESKFRFTYAFHDFNAKVTHLLSRNNKLWLSLYSGMDNYGIKDEDAWYDYQTTTDNKFRWGNLNATLAGDFQLSNRLSNNTSFIASYSYTNQSMNEDDIYYPEPDIRFRNSLDISHNKTKMLDLGIKTDFTFFPHPKHTLRFGGAFTVHWFNPQTVMQSFYFGDPSEHVDTTDVSGRMKMSSIETQLYAEDDIVLNHWINANMGTSCTFYQVSDKTFLSFDPRLSIRWHPVTPLTFKISYTHMSQSIHRIASTFLDIPSDFWAPSTAVIPPVRSHQVAAGIYTQVSPGLTFSLEGYLKCSDNLLQYRHWMGLQPPAAFWKQNVTQGRGKAYGIEMEARYRTRRLTAQMAYTLSWSKRKFPELYDGWFYDQFDNRHRLNTTIRYTMTKKISVYVALTLKSGNRVSFPMASAVNPRMPEDDYNHELTYIYGKPNGLSLPLYHRLDLGFNFKHTTRKGHEAIWNVSVYNAYCHLNTIYAKVRQANDGSIAAKAKGYIPIIPSVSYTIKF